MSRTERCSTCSHEFQVEDSILESTSACPNCGNVNHAEPNFAELDLSSLPPLIDAAQQPPPGPQQNESFEGSPFDLPTEPAASSPLLSAPQPNPDQTKKPEPKQPASDAKTNFTFIIAAVAGGLLTMMLAIGLAIWMLSSGDTDNASKAANSAADSNTGSVPDPINTDNSNQTHFPWDPKEHQLAYGKKIERAVEIKIADTPTSDVIETMKRRTVIVRVGSGSAATIGSGLIVRASDVNGMVFTSSDLFPTLLADQKPRIECIVQSGTAQQKVIEASLRFLDHEKHLAGVMLRGAPEIGEAFEFDLGDGMPEAENAYVIGCPASFQSSSANQTPAVVVTESIITAMPDNPMPHSVFIQDGVHPKSLGATIVSKEGTLLGLVTTQLKPSDSGAGISSRQLTEESDGRVTAVHCSQSESYSNGGKYRFELLTYDPQFLLSRVNLLAFHREQQIAESPNADGQWPLAAEKTIAEMPLRFGSSPAAMGGEFRIAGRSDDLMIQVRLEHKTRGVIYGRPMKLADLQPARKISYSNRVRPAKSAEAADDFQISVVPDYMWDWKMRPDNGDILGLSGTQNRVYLFKGATLGDDDYSDLPAFDLPGPAVAACWKPLGDRNYWIVLCTDDNQAHVIDADTLTMMNPIKLDVAGFSKSLSITASTNPNDPFVYFCGGNNSFLRAIDLRSMTSLGVIAKGRCELCRVTPNGDAIHVGDGMNARLLTVLHDSDSKAPKFVDSGLSNSKDLTTPSDPLQEYSLLNNIIRRNGQREVLAAINDGEIAFYFAKQPVVAEINATDRRGSRAKQGFLQFWSLETGKKLGNKHTLPGVFVEAGFPSGLKYLRSIPIYRQRGLFIDEVNGNVVLALNNQIYHRSIESLEFPDRRRLTPRIAKETFQVGTQSMLSIQADQDVAIDYQDLVPGMEPVDGGIRWRPKSSDIGDHTLNVELSYRDQSRVVPVPVEVVSPFLAVPILIRDFVISPRGDFCVAWSGDPRRLTESDPPKLALISLRDKTKMKHQEIPQPIMKAVLMGTQLATWSPENREQLSVYDLKTLTLAKTILTPDAIETFDTDGTTLRIQCERSIETYNVRSLSRLKSEPKSQRGSQPVKSTVTYLDGTLDNGILRSAETGDPILFVSPGNVPVHNVRRFESTRAVTSQSLRKITPESKLFNDAKGDPIRMTYIDQSADPGSPLRVSLWVQADKTDQRLALAVIGPTGDVATVPLGREPFDPTKARINPVVHVTSGGVYIASKERLYRWDPPEQLEELFDGPSDDEHPRFVPRQSEFVLRGRNPKLEHRIVGGKAPFEFTLFTELDALSMDSSTGIISVGTKDLTESLAQSRASVFGMYSKGGTFEVQLAKAAEQGGEAFQQLTGQKAKGFPTAIPIKIKAVDQNGEVAQLDYFVMFDLPLGDIIRARKSMGK